MRRPITLLALALALGVSHALLAASPVLPAAGAAALVQLLDATTRRGDVPAVVVLVTNADKVIFTHAAGRRDVAAGAPLSQDAIFRIASMGKPMTSAAIMMLKESGRLGLDDPAGRYVPGIDALKVVTRVNPDGSLELRPPRRPITIRHLLTHTSGIGYSFSDPILFKLQQAGKGEQDLPLLHDPGDKWTYGASTRYLGDIVERVSGQSLDTLPARAPYRTSRDGRHLVRGCRGRPLPPGDAASARGRQADGAAEPGRRREVPYGAMAASSRRPRTTARFCACS